jgi:hypothetical protein
MAIEFKNKELIDEKELIYLKITDKLTTKDYDDFIPEVDQKIEKYGKISMLVELKDFHGWSAGAAWEDAKFGIKHFHDIEKLAFVGDKAWEKGMAMFCKVFTAAEVRYFDANEENQLEAAKDWIKQSSNQRAA